MSTTAIHTSSSATRRTVQKRSSAMGPAMQNPGDRYYRPELDALRAFAFLLVFGRHVAVFFGFVKQRADLAASASHPAPQLAATAATNAAVHAAAPAGKWALIQSAAQSLDFGVCLFFFLSAFLITRLLLNERQKTGKVAVGAFYIRRCLRIWPLYFVFLAIVVLASHFASVFDISRPRLLAAIFFVGNWAAVFHGWENLAIQPLWSVSVEEQFYLLWPNLARRGKPVIVAMSLFFAAVAIVTLIVLGHRAGTEVTQVWPNTLVQSLFLSGGALTACLSSPEDRRLSVPVRLLMMLCGFASWITASVGFHIVRTESPGSLSLVAGYLLVLLGTFLIFTSAAGWTATRIPRWLLYLGKISYGLYVFHFACLMVMERAVAYALPRIHGVHLSPYPAEGVSVLLALGLTIVCASISYACIEKPALRYKERFTKIESRPA